MSAPEPSLTARQAELADEVYAWADTGSGRDAWQAFLDTGWDDNADIVDYIVTVALAPSYDDEKARIIAAVTPRLKALFDGYTPKPVRRPSVDEKTQRPCQWCGKYVCDCGYDRFRFAPPRN